MPQSTRTMAIVWGLLAVLARAQPDPAGGVLRPAIAGDWWQVAHSPVLPELRSAPGVVVDHCFFALADGTWQLWTQIRGTRHGRVFFRWAGTKGFVNGGKPWRPLGVCWLGDPHAGEMPRVIQAPYCYTEAGRWHLFYGGGGCVCRADSADGVHFRRRSDSNGRSRLLADLSDRQPSGMRDPFLLRTGKRYCLYYTWKTHVMVCTADSPTAEKWSEPTIARTRAGGAQSPTVVQVGGWFYLFTMGPSDAYATEVYASRTPLDFRPGRGELVTTLPVSAAEVLRVGDRWYISSLIPKRGSTGNVIGHAGVRVAPLAWHAE